MRRGEEIVATVERAVGDGALAPGSLLPTVRELAAQLGVSPTTVASAYRTLSARGVVAGRGRQGTRVSAGPALPTRAAPIVPEGVRNLAHGSPDPALLPRLRTILRRIDPPPIGYGDAQADLAEIQNLALRQFLADGIPAERILVVGGALDGVERTLLAHLRPGDRVAVEDPGFPRVFDLVAALGLVPMAVPVDERGMTPKRLDSAVRHGASAAILTPRAQNPTGAAFDDERAVELRQILRRHPDLLVIEDDHAGPIAGTAARTVIDGDRPRWAVVRSVAKSLGPDLRVAVLTGDRTTLDRVEGRLRLGACWVSHILQSIVVDCWSDPRTESLVDKARSAYAQRRAALIDALSAHGIDATGPTGLNVWVPVPNEDSVISGLLARGWAVAGGERFRIRSGPAIRISIATLDTDEAGALADDLATVLHPATLPTTVA